MSSFLNEDGNMYGTEIHKIIKAVLLDRFGKKVSDDQAKRISSNLSISDVIALDAAIDKNDNDQILDVLNLTDLMNEYSYPGRAGLKSAASSRQTSKKNEPSAPAARSSTSIAGAPKAPAAPVTGQSASSTAEEPDDDVEDEENVSEDYARELELLKRRLR